MYTIDEPYINTPEATEGNVPFFLVKDLNGNTVYFVVTKQECQIWISNQ